MRSSNCMRRARKDRNTNRYGTLKHVLLSSLLEKASPNTQYVAHKSRCTINASSAVLYTLSLLTLNQISPHTKGQFSNRALSKVNPSHPIMLYPLSVTNLILSRTSLLGFWIAYRCESNLQFCFSDLWRIGNSKKLSVRCQ